MSFFPRPWRTEALILALLFFVAILSARLAIGDWDGLRSSMGWQFYVPAVTWAHGGGLTYASGDYQLEAFLTGTNEAWQPDSFADLTFNDPGMHKDLHRYLLLLMGVWMRLFGTTAESVQTLTGVMAGAAAIAVYALFRVFMGRTLSLLGAILFLSAPAVTHDLPNFRDFSKVPFMVGVIACIAVLLAKRPQGYRVFLLALCLGLLTGIGFGFRRDMLLYVPAALIALAVPLRPGGLRRWAVHGGAAVLCAAVFVMAAFPILASMAEYGSLGYHDTLMGMSAPREHAIGLEAASYTRFYYQWDTLAHAMAEAYGKAAGLSEQPLNIYSAPSSELKRKLIIDLAATFPADFIGRGLAGVARVLTGDPAWSNWWGAPEYPDHFLEIPITLFSLLARVTAPFIAVAMFAWLVVARPRTALLLFIIALILLGQINLQYETRHVVQLTFVHIFLVLLFMRVAWSISVRLRGGGWDALRPRLQVSTRAVSYGGLAAGAALAAVLTSAIVVQESQVRALEAAFRALEPVELDTAPVTLDETVLFVPAPRVYERHYPPGHWFEWQRTYYRVTLTAADDPIDLWMTNESFRGLETLHARIVLPPFLREGDRVHFFFPGFECIEGTRWARFTGVKLLASEAHRFHGLALMEGSEDIPLSPCFVLPADDESVPIKHRQMVSLLERPRTYGYIHQPPDGLPAPGQWLLPVPREQRLEQVMEYHRHNPSSRRWAMMLAQYQLEVGDLEGASNHYKHVLAQHPKDVSMYEALDVVWQQWLEPVSHRDRWRGIIAGEPENAYAWLMLGAVLRDRMNAPDAARAAFERAWDLGCRDARLTAFLGSEPGTAGPARNNKGAPPS